VFEQYETDHSGLHDLRKGVSANNLNKLRFVVRLESWIVKQISERLLGLMPHLNEDQQRIAAALEARSLGYAGFCGGGRERASARTFTGA